MQRFFGRILRKARDVSAPPVLIVAFGDSVTQGVVEHGQFDFDHTYHRLLQTLLERHFPTTTFSTLNAGVSGSTAQQALIRLERDVIRHQPDLVLVAFGLNDAVIGGDKGLPEFGATIREIVAVTHAKTEADVVLLTPPHMAGLSQPHKIHPAHAEIADRIIAAQREGVLARYADATRELGSRLAKESGRLVVADIHAEWTRLRETGVDVDQWFTNGLNHPDPRGQQLAATSVFHVLLSNPAEQT